MDNKRCVEILNQGISEKRKGNYKKALYLYAKSKEFNPYNENIYYNSGKLLCGIGKYDDALKNFFTFACLTVFNDAFVNNPVTIRTAKEIFEQISNLEFSLPIGCSFPSDFHQLLTNNRLKLLLADTNLNFYMGFSFLAKNSFFQKHYSISETQVQDLRNGLLGKECKVYLKQERYRFILIYYGLLLLLKNIKFESLSIENIPTFYLNDSYKIIPPVNEIEIIKDDFLDRNPEDEELDRYLSVVQKILREEYCLKSIYLGYNLLTPSIFKEPKFKLVNIVNIGHTDTFGFNYKTLEKILAQSDKAYLCYLALPIDENDFLIENDMPDLEFESSLIKRFKSNFIAYGTVNKNEFKMCRTFKFLYGKQ